MAASDLDTYIGDIGRYQWQVFITLCVFNLFNSHAIHIVFLAANMPHWCRVPELSELPYDVQKNVAIPSLQRRLTTSDHDDESAAAAAAGGPVEYSSCEMYALNYSVYNRSQFVSWNRSRIISEETPVVACSQWIYDQSQFVSTIVSKVGFNQSIRQ